LKIIEYLRIWLWKEEIYAEYLRKEERKEEDLEREFK
jgi:hypothetical protein